MELCKGQKTRFGRLIVTETALNLYAARATSPHTRVIQTLFQAEAKAFHFA